MNRSDLVETLQRARISDTLYDIPGVHDIAVRPDAYYFLRPDSDVWIVGVREYSRDSVTARFPTEDEACRYLYERLIELPAPVTGVRRPPPGGVGTSGASEVPAAPGVPEQRSDSEPAPGREPSADRKPSADPEPRSS